MLSRLVVEWDEPRFDRLVEFLSAVVLSLATVGTAWCGYQAARWGGQQETQFVEAIGAYIDSAKLSNRAQQVDALYVDLFVEWLSATNRGDHSTADFLYQRFPVTLKAAMDAWLALDPFANPDTPSSPFDMPLYVLPESEEAERLSQAADELFTQAASANQTSDNYVLLTVIFASVLFFGGISGKFRSRVIDLVILCMAFVLFVTGLAMLITLPIY
jgi:hypothetical protein